MKLTLELPGLVRVRPASDYKGNPVTVVMIGGKEVIYAAGHVPGGMPASSWEDVISTRLASMLADLLIADLSNRADPEPLWHRESPTGRETWPDGAHRQVTLREELDEE